MSTIIVEKHTKIVLYADRDLTENGVFCDKWRDRTTTTATADQFEVDALPENFGGGWYTWTAADGFQRTELGDACVESILLEEVEKKKTEIKAERDRRIALGVPYTFPDGKTGTIQTRDSRDIQNVLTITVRAMSLISLGDSTSTVSIWDEDGVKHDMNGLQAAEMGNFAGAWGENLWHTAKNHHVALEAIAADDGVSLDQRIDQVKNYDYSGGWPA